MTPKVIRSQAQQRSGINDEELHSQVSDLLIELKEVQSSVHHLLDNYILKVGPLTQLQYSKRMLKRSVDSLQATAQLIQMENNQ